MYAHVTSGTVDAVGNPPRTALVGGRWWDLRDREPDRLAAAGWFIVQEIPKPADTPTATWDPQFVPDDGTVEQSWIERPKTQEEIDLATAEANRGTLANDARSDIDLLKESVTALNVVIGKNNNAINAGDTRQIAQESRRIARALLRVLRLQLDATDSTDIGA